MNKQLNAVFYNITSPKSTKGKPRNGTGAVNRLTRETVEAAVAEAAHYGYELNVTVIEAYKTFVDFQSGSYMPKDVPEWMRPVEKLVDEADFLAFVLPTQWFGASAMTHNVVEHHIQLDNTPALKGKPIIAVAHCHDDGGKAAAMYAIIALNNGGMENPANGSSFRNAGSPQGGDQGRQKTEHRLAAQNAVRAAIRRRILKEQGFDDNGWMLRKVA